MRRISRHIAFVTLVFFLSDSKAQVVTTADSATTTRILAPSLFTDVTKGNAIRSDGSTIYHLRRNPAEPDAFRRWTFGKLASDQGSATDGEVLLALGVTIGVGVILTVADGWSARRLLDLGSPPSTCSPSRRGWGNCRYSAWLGDWVYDAEMIVPEISRRPTGVSPTEELCGFGLLDTDQFRTNTSCTISDKGQSDAGSATTKDIPP
jgi:hypothetical protein